MNTIDSFQINHNKLEKGVYLSRQDEVAGALVTTYDIRVCAPYKDKPMTPEVAHTIEHIGATYMREHYKNTIYFGPMGCLTGFYLVTVGTLSEEARVDIVNEILCAVQDTMEIPGATRKQCGNYMLHDLFEAKQFVEQLIGSKMKVDYPNNDGKAEDLLVIIGILDKGKPLYVKSFCTMGIVYTDLIPEANLFNKGEVGDFIKNYYSSIEKVIIEIV